MQITITLDIDAGAKEAHILNAIAATLGQVAYEAEHPKAPPTIAPEDAPDVGKPDEPQPDAASVFGGKPASVPGLPSADTAPNDAPALDAAGLPWDERIHASSKAITEKGVWRMRRGLNDPGLVQRVEAELRGAPPAPAAVATLSPAGAAVGLPLPPPPASAPVPVAPVTTFTDLMQKVTKLMADKVMTREDLDAAVMAAGLTMVTDLMNRPDMVPAVNAELDKLLAD